MGAWGITAFESDSGLDGIGMIRAQMDGSGKLDLAKLIPLLDTGASTYGYSHTKHMGLAELMIKFADHDLKHIDLDDDPPAVRFDHVTSFTADKESIQWIKQHLAELLKDARAEAPARLKYEGTYGGWFAEKDWIGWQKHMENLISRMDELLQSPGETVDLAHYSPKQVHYQEPTMGM